MSFKVIDLRSGTKGVLHQWRHTGSKSREVLWYICKYPERGPLITCRRIASTTRHNRRGRRVPTAFHGIHPGLGKTKSSSERPALHLGYVFTKVMVQSTTRLKVNHSICSQIGKRSVQGREAKDGGNGPANTSKRLIGFAFAIWYQAQQAHFADS